MDLYESNEPDNHICMFHTLYMELDADTLNLHHSHIGSLQFSSNLQEVHPIHMQQRFLSANSLHLHLQHNCPDLLRYINHDFEIFLKAYHQQIHLAIHFHHKPTHPFQDQNGMDLYFVRFSVFIL